MDDSKEPPLVFANNVIRETVDHVVTGGVIILPQDYTALRVAYRKLGGSWAKIADGDIASIRLLTRIVKRWGKMPNRKRKSEFT